MESLEFIAGSLEPQKLMPAFEVQAVFCDKQYLEQVCEQMLGKYITGYSITENETSYIWDDKVERKKNYCASIIIQVQKAKEVISYIHAQISKKWKTPLIKATPCMVNSDFYDYLAAA